MQVNLSQFTGRILVLFPCTFVEDCKDRLRKVLKAFGYAPLPMPGDGDCFFYCISENVSSILRSENCNLASHLQSLALSQHVNKCDKISVLRQLIVEEFTGPNSHVYEPFLVTSPNRYDEEAW